MEQALGRPFGVARTQLALGSVQRRARQWRAARTSLEEAERRFGELGAEGWAKRARARGGAGRRPAHRRPR